MEYHVGMRLIFRRDDRHTPAELVEVVQLRKHGAALLSNGWVVDEDGIAEGTARVRGGSVVVDPRNKD